LKQQVEGAMEFLYPNILLPQDKKILESINTAASILSDKFNSLTIDTLSLSDYTIRYLKEYLNSFKFSLRRYTHLLAWALAYTKIPLDQFCLIDYGGGVGLLSLLAKERGIGRVIYADIYDISCKDAKSIGRAINAEADDYIHGDINTLHRFLLNNTNNALSSYTVVSNDVIEHIYDIEDFFFKLTKFPGGDITLILASGANPYNPIIKRELVRRHKEVEYQNREETFGHKQRDALESYFSIRKKIVSCHSPCLSEAEIDLLSKATRGLIEADIKNSVDEFINTGMITQKPTHPTNTCDPYTGNWAEQLMDIKQLRNILLNGGFKAEIISGYYDGFSRRRLKRLIIPFVNMLISLWKTGSLMIAPYFIIYGRRQSTY
jgi:2-polyprenyl-3-methyl-5-hydroxy-6-metoxy-1,4-benzoquinol methylase